MSNTPPAPPLRIGIALSGGGARGIAHIGVLRALLEADIVPTVVAGTSSGAIVGCLYASGMSVADMEAFARIGSSLKILRIGNPLKGLMKLTMLREKLDEVLHADDFAELEYPLAVVSSDLQHGRVAIHRSGELIGAVQASCAIPLVFRPVDLGGVQHIDGGLFMNLPADAIRGEVDFLIGSNVMPLVNHEVPPLDNMVAIGRRVFDLSVNLTTAPSAELCDYVVEAAEIEAFNFYNFSRTEELIAVGYAAGRAALPGLRKRLAAVRRQHKRAGLRARASAPAQKTSTRGSSAR